MLIVAKGKVIRGRHIIGLGGELDGLSLEAEERLIAAGVAKRVGAGEAGEPDAEDEGVRVPAEAKEPSRAELQERCRELGLSAQGNKKELQARIDEYERAEAEEAEADADDDGDEPPELTAEVPR